MPGLVHGPQQPGQLAVEPQRHPRRALRLHRVGDAVGPDVHVAVDDHRWTVLHQLLGQRVEDDLGGPLVDPHRPGLAVEPLDLAAAHQSEPAHHWTTGRRPGRPSRWRRPWPSTRGAARRAGRARRPRRPGRSSRAPSRSRPSWSASLDGTGAERERAACRTAHAVVACAEASSSAAWATPTAAPRDRDAEGRERGEHQLEALALARRCGGRAAPGRPRRRRRRARAAR